jgi:hypothetical protein
MGVHTDIGTELVGIYPDARNVLVSAPFTVVVNESLMQRSVIIWAGSESE